MNMSLTKAMRLATATVYMRPQGGQWIVCEKVTRENQGYFESYWQESQTRFYHAARDAMTRARALETLRLLGYPPESIQWACDEGGPLKARVTECMRRYPLSLALAQFQQDSEETAQ